MTACADPFVTAPLALIDFGVFCPDDSDGVRVDAPGTELGYIHRSTEDPVVAIRSTRVPAALGFGFGMKLKALPGTRLFDADVVVTHPSGLTGKSVAERWTADFGDDFVTTDRFTFDFKHELAIGAWTFEVRKDGAVLFHQEFQVVAAQDVPDITNGCGRDRPLS